MMHSRSNGRGRERPALVNQNEPALPFRAVNWARLFGYLKPYRGRMAFAVLALLVSGGFGLAFPLVIVRLLDSVTQINSDAPLNLLAGMLIGIFLLQAAFNFLQSYLLAYIGERIVYDLRTSLYTQLQRLSLDFYAVRRVGDLVSRLSGDVTQMRTMLTTTITAFLSQVLMLIGSVAILLTLKYPLYPVHPGAGACGDPRCLCVWGPDPKRQHADTGPTCRFDGRRRRRIARHPCGQELWARSL